MNEFEEWSMQRYEQGREEGIQIGYNQGIKKDEQNKCLNTLTKNLINRSKQQGKALSREDALKQAEAMLSYSDVHLSV